MPDIITRDRQSLIDIGMQESGTATSAFDLATANGLSVTEDLYTGQLLVPVAKIETPVLEMFAREGRKPATAESPLDISTGIGFMGIEYDFIVG